jgi:hypothetical protein
LTVLPWFRMRPCWTSCRRRPNMPVRCPRYSP